MRFVTKKEAKQNRSESNAISRPKDGLKEPLMGLRVEPQPGVPMDLFMHCKEKYANNSWFGSIVKNGWPGIKGKVKLGVPIVDKFNEVIVVYRNENGYMKSRSLGKASQKR